VSAPQSSTHDAVRRRLAETFTITAEYDPNPERCTRALLTVLGWPTPAVDPTEAAHRRAEHTR